MFYDLTEGVYLMLVCLFVLQKYIHSLTMTGQSMFVFLL